MFIDYIWEYIVNLIELILFILFIHMKLHIKTELKQRTYLIFSFALMQFITLCFMNALELSSYVTLLSSCILDIADEMCVTNKGVPKELECPFFYIWGITGGEKSYIDCRK